MLGLPVVAIGALAFGPLALGGCGSADIAAQSPTNGKSDGKPARLVTMVTPSRLIPEVDADHFSPWFNDEGQAKHVLGGVRMQVDEDGHIERATDRLPNANVQAVPLPDHLGGGYVFYQSDSQGTRLWRSETWTSALEALTYIGPGTDEVIPGFDRLYLRTTVNKIMAVDLDTGQLMPLGGLPVAPRLGAMVFADGWRAVVDTDLRGPLATFDAGATWSPLALSEDVASAALLEGDPVLYVGTGSYRVDAGGHLQYVSYEGAAVEETVEEEAPADHKRATHPLGERPLRTAITRGWPDTSESAVVLYKGKLVRVAIPSAKVLAKTKVDLGEEVTCQGIRVGAGFGFVCGEEDGPTTVQLFRPPLGLETLIKFDKPRFVASSGNGSLSIRGKCSGEGGETKDMRTYCILGAGGGQREIAIRGEVGAERVVALADGRVVVLVPPRFDRPGRLTLIDGDKVSGTDLKYPTEPRLAVKVARRGLWLDGFEERKKNVVSGWVEAGGPAVGVSVDMKGNVTLGEVYDDGGQLLMAGRFAFASTDGETGVESIDGGKTWTELDLPRLPESPGDDKTRGCTPVGCALRGWLRAGWGKPAVKSDMAVVAPPAPVTVRPASATSVLMTCVVTGLPPPPAEPAPMYGYGEYAPYSSWIPFRNSPPPKLGKDEIGVDKSSQYYDDIGAHVYVWGPKGADWSRSGWWQLRFDDPFDPGNSVRSSAPTRPPWSDDVTASEAIGARQYGSYWRWEATLDPGGHAALVNVCAGSQCEYYGVSEGRPILELKTQMPAAAGYMGYYPYQYLRPVPGGVVRIGETWFMLTENSLGGPLAIWRADLGTLREVLSFRRLYDRRHMGNAVTPQLVRRAHGSDIGILFQEAPDPFTGEYVADWVVLPFDPGSGVLGEPIRLGRADLDGRMPKRCSEADDGWLLETTLATTPDVSLDVASYVDEVRFRLRIEPGGRCVEAVSAKTGRAIDLPAKGKPRVAPAEYTIPMAVRERYTARGWSFACREGRSPTAGAVFGVEGPSVDMVELVAP
jgi:hypothetical protein